MVANDEQTFDTCLKVQVAGLDQQIQMNYDMKDPDWKGTY